MEVNAVIQCLILSGQEETINSSLWIKVGHTKSTNDVV